MEDTQIPLISDLPVTDEPKSKQRPRINCLQDMLLELMDERNVTPAQIQKATGIPWGTLAAWISGSVNCQLADQNLLKLARFFNVDLFYLLYGIGDGSEYFKEFKEEDTGG
jgi:hypothetical protein